MIRSRSSRNLLRGILDCTGWECARRLYFAHDGGENGPLAERLRDALDGRLEGYLRTDEASRALWSTDASIYLRRPVGVVVARSRRT